MAQRFHPSDLLHEGEEYSRESQEGEDDYMRRLHATIEEFKAGVNEDSSFATAGELVSVPPVCVAEGVGRIGYPLCSQQATALLKVATQAPFGKGTKTVVDTDVRQAWQISSDLVKIDPQWLNSSLSALVADCCRQLGINAKMMNVRAELYKMLLYEKGGHFKKHKDTERGQGMFGSLLIQLPAQHEGGHLCVEHAGLELKFEHDKDSADKAYYAAFYADCDHELQPVTSGLRLVLAFNLVHDAPAGANTASASSMTSFRNAFDQTLAKATKAWRADDDAKTKFAYPLEHKYTKTNLSFAGLKGKDATALSLLHNATDHGTGKKLFRVYLALVQKHLIGSSDNHGGGYGGYRGGYHRWRGGYESDGSGGMDFSCDVETNYNTESWVGPAGYEDFEGLEVDLESEILTSDGRKYDVDDNEGKGMFGDEPDSKEVEGYQGNYAGSCEYWYNSAVLVFWPAENDFDLMLTLGIPHVIETLQDMDRTQADYGIKLAKVLSYLHRKKKKNLSQAPIQMWGIPLSYSTRTRHNTVKADVAPEYILDSVLPLTLTLEQAKEVLALGVGSSSLSNVDARQKVALQVMKYGILAFQEELDKMIKAQNSQHDVMELLRLMEPRTSEEEARQVWNGLVKSMTSAVEFDLTVQQMIDISDFFINTFDNVKMHVNTAKKMLKCRQCTQKMDSESTVKLVSNLVGKHGIETLHVEVDALLAQLRLGDELDLLSALKSCALDEAAWSNLVKSFTARVLNLNKSILSDTGSYRVPLFIVENCDAETQLSVAELYGRYAQLGVLNAVIPTLGDTANPDIASFREKLLSYTVSILLNDESASFSDVAAMVDWVLAGKHLELLTKLLPELTRLCSITSPNRFDAIFAMPAVMAEMKSKPPSALRAQLEILVYARIEVLAKLMVIPEFTWRQPGVKVYDNRYPLVNDFFASDLSTGVIKGVFRNINEARSLADAIKQKTLGKCEASGSGKSAQVVITKNRSIYNATKEKCKLKAEEHAKLCQMLGLPQEKASPSPAGAKRKLDVAAAEKQPAAKKVINLC